MPARLWPFRSAAASLVGVDVGSAAIHVVEVEPDSLRMRGMSEIATPPGSFAGGQVLDAPALGRAIRTALRQAGLRNRRAALAVPTQVGFVRKMTFPRMPVRELRAAVALQPERYVPMARDGGVYDLQVLPGEAPAGQVWAVIAAAPKDSVSGLLEACRFAGVTAVRVDLELLALHRALVALEQVEPGAALGIVDLGAHTAKIGLFEGEVPVITRVVDLPQPEVEGATDPFAGVSTSDLFLEIRRSLEFAFTQTAAVPARVFMAGGAGNDPYLMLSLSAYVRGYLADRLPPDFEVRPVAAPELGLSQAHMLAFGLSLLPERFA